MEKNIGAKTRKKEGIEINSRNETVEDNSSKYFIKFKVTNLI